MSMKNSGNKQVLPNCVCGCLNVCDNSAALIRIENTLFAVRHVVELDVYVFPTAGINLFSQAIVSAQRYKWFSFCFITCLS